MSAAGGHRLGLEGKRVLVTGGTRGLGLAIARKLSACGCEVVLNFAGSPEQAAKAAAGIEAAGAAVSLVRADVGTPEGVEALLETVARRYGGLDVFVHNAASFTPMPALAPDPGAAWRDLAVALTPLLCGARALAGLLPAGGRIIAVSSTGAHDVVPGYVGLGMAKAALESQIRYLAVELAQRGVTVNAVSTAKLDKGESPPPAAVGALAARTPAGRLTVPQDVADVVALLCAPEAAWIQGQVVHADGGLGLRA
ncbi:SDR family oxidoreductase [Streptomyces sp. NPDC006193]|uniref:SDR family oxidoreductase n=1 Tax=Streptomyces sp. NPDC006193 TaxID=3155717 RepID=UPI0033B77A29